MYFKNTINYNGNPQTAHFDTTAINFCPSSSLNIACPSGFLKCFPLKLLGIYYVCIYLI